MAKKQPTQPHNKIRDRFILFFIILAVVPVLMLSGVALYLLDQSHRHSVSNLELQVIEQKIEEIDKFIDDTLGILKLRVAVDETQDIVLASQEFILEGLLEENPAFMDVSFISRPGLETSRRSRLSIADQLNDVSQLDYFQTAIQGRPYIGQVFYTLSGPSLVLAAPVIGNKGAVLHVIAAEVNLASLVRTIARTSFGTSGYAILLDQRGRLIAQGAVYDISTGTSFIASARVQRVLKGVTLDALDSKDRYTSLIDQQPVVGAGRLVPKLGWAVLVEWPLKDADAIIQDIRLQAVLFTALVIFAVLLLAPLFASRLVKPIKQLQKAAEDIEQGKYDTEVDIQTKDELAELGTAFNKMAQGLKRLQELKNEFVFIAAHELRSPVTAIKGYLSIIFEDFQATLTKETKKILQTVQNSNDRLVELVNNILVIARSDAGRMKIEVSPVSLKDNVQAVLEEVKPLAQDKNISLKYDQLSKLPQVLADSARLKEVMMNFVSNAIKYNNQGGWIKVSHQIKKASVITHVADNGLGLSEADQKHLFEKFFRSEADEFKEIEGTGLGLFITKELIEKMHGQVWFKSSKGRGTTFSFSLPRVK